MKRIATIAALLLLGLNAMLGVAWPASPAGEAASNAMAQSIRRHVRPTIVVRPGYYPYRRYHALYPPPYDIEYPGPNAHRECVDAYVTEHRPSGTVIVPKMHCRWVRGYYAGP